MVVVWGLNLKEMQWRKFKGSYMWGNLYHQRRRRFIVYQLAMILCVVSESLGTDVLSKYLDQQNAVRREGASRGQSVTVLSDDLVRSFSYNIFVGVFVATIFGAAFFFDLFWPERHEIIGVKNAWRICSVLACCFALSSAIVLTVVLSTHRAVLTGPTGVDVLRPPLVYKNNGKAIASLVLIWLGWLATTWSTCLMWTSISHIDKYGPFSAHARPINVEKGASEAVDGNMTQQTTTQAAETDEEEKKVSDEASTIADLESGDAHRPPSTPTSAADTVH